MQNTVKMVLESTIVEHIVKLKLTIYRKYICYNKKGMPMLYVQLKKALYCMLQSALLFWKLLSDMLIGRGFTYNP